jgi:hypothetical protein
MKSSTLTLTLLLIVCVSTFAQEEEKKAAPPKFVVPPDVNGNKTVIALPENRRPIKVGVYSGPGAPQSSVDAVVKVMKPFAEATTVIMSGEDVATQNLAAYDVLVFPGGSGSGQSKGIGEAGLKNVRLWAKAAAMWVYARELISRARIFHGDSAFSTRAPSPANGVAVRRSSTWR